ncbi:MAG: hypothetical protein VX910_04490 [Candidatus Latescibacterota bacterium]|nr:hypothetical protein [Candidatus Latescibacterota bacterium]
MVQVVTFADISHKEVSAWFDALAGKKDLVMDSTEDGTVYIENKNYSEGRKPKGA